jgi:hypothetical protein
MRAMAQSTSLRQPTRSQEANAKNRRRLAPLGMTVWFWQLTEEEQRIEPMQPRHTLSKGFAFPPVGVTRLLRGGEGRSFAGELSFA